METKKKKNIRLEKNLNNVCLHTYENKNINLQKEKKREKEKNKTPWIRKKKKKIMHAIEITKTNLEYVFENDIPLDCWQCKVP